MKKRKSTKSTSQSKVRTPHKSLAEEVGAWENGGYARDRWVDIPAAVPRGGESKSVSIRIPIAMLRILKGFAEAEGIGYQVLMKKWLDDRIRLERDRMAGKTSSVASIRPAGVRYAPPVEGLVDSADVSGPHYHRVA